MDFGRTNSVGTWRAGWIGRAWRAGALAWLVIVGVAARAAPRSGGDDPPDEALVAELVAKLGGNEKKLEALVQRVDKAVRKALASTPFPGSTPAAPRALDSHPFLALVTDLVAEAKAQPTKPSARANELLGRYPWSERLDFVCGLDYGSDRPVPEHLNGFIALGALPDPAPGFHELCANVYLYGLQEVVGWQGCVDPKKTLFRPRKAKDAVPALETALLPADALRVYLAGSLPEVPLYAIPRLTHRIHARLAERRAAGGTPAPMDEMLAFLDARWNAFSFQAPRAKTRTPIALPVFLLISDRKAFPYRFPTGEHLGGVGDIPFVSDPTLREYARTFRSESIEVSEFIADSDRGAAARAAFWQDCTYLGRYRALVELFVRAILAPGLPLPAFLEDYDYAGGKPPADRAAARDVDVPRKHALTLWAFVGKDPLVLADFLHEQVLDLEVNRFPKNASLATELAYVVRKRDREILARLEERASGATAGDFAPEFSPFATLLDPASEANTGHLVDSFRSFHAPLAEAIRSAALGVLRDELGK